MTYVEPRQIRDFYLRAIKMRPVTVRLHMLPGDWHLSIGDAEPAGVSLVGRYTIDTPLRQFAEDVQATAGEMVRAAA